MWKMDDLHNPIGFSRALTLTLMLHNYDVKMSSGLAACTKRFPVFQPVDWPCQFYSREIMYESLKKFVSCCSHPVLTTTLEGHDWSLFPFIPIASCYCWKSLKQQLAAEHITAHSVCSANYRASSHFLKNSTEHVVNPYHSFFKTVYEATFPRSKLADNPKPWRISLILEIVYEGWILIRHAVMRKFSRLLARK